MAAPPVRLYADERRYVGEILKELKAHRETVANGILTGVPTDYAEYKSRTGELRGLDIAIRLMTEEQEAHG